MCTADNVDQLLQGNPDYVLDAIDNIDTKVRLQAVKVPVRCSCQHTRGGLTWLSGWLSNAVASTQCMCKAVVLTLEGQLTVFSSAPHCTTSAALHMSSPALTAHRVAIQTHSNRSKSLPDDLPGGCRGKRVACVTPTCGVVTAPPVQAPPVHGTSDSDSLCCRPAGCTAGSLQAARHQGVVCGWCWGQGRPHTRTYPGRQRVARGPPRTRCQAQVSAVCVQERAHAQQQSPQQHRH